MDASMEIDPTSFDAIVLGTGFPESILAGAIAKSGLAVLHIDIADFYGSHWATLPLDTLKSWAASGGLIPPPIAERSPPTSAELPNGSNDCKHDRGNDGDDDNNDDDEPAFRVPSLPNELADSTDAGLLESQGLYSVPLPQPSSETSMYSNMVFYDYHSDSLGPSRSYNIDICGPKLLMCSEELIDNLIASGAHNYTEYKPIENTFVYENQTFMPVPASRANIFQQPMTLPQKHNLWKFLKQVAQYAESDSLDLSEDAMTSENVGSGQPFGFHDLTMEDLASPFLQFLLKRKLPDLVQKYILYCIALIDQEQGPERLNFISTQEGLKRMAIYLRSIGRFGSSSQTAFIYPIFGIGEISQAFCRVSAVNGALYVLRHPVKSLLIDSASGHCRGILTKSGQFLSASRIILGPSFLPEKIHFSIPQSTNVASYDNSTELQYTESFKFYHVARFICITDRSLVPDHSNIVIFVPPKSLEYGNENVLKILQTSSSVKVCPENKFVVMISMKLNDGDLGSETILQPFVHQLFDVYDLKDSIKSEESDEHVPSQSTQNEAQDETSDGNVTRIKSEESELNHEQDLEHVQKGKEIDAETSHKSDLDDKDSIDEVERDSSDDNAAEDKFKNMTEDIQQKQLEDEINRSLNLNDAVEKNGRPKMYWCVYFTQKIWEDDQLHDILPEGLGICNMPDAHLNFTAALKNVQSIFTRLFPEAAFFPSSAGGANQGEDDPGAADGQSLDDDPEADLLDQAFPNPGVEPQSSLPTEP